MNRFEVAATCTIVFSDVVARNGEEAINLVVKSIPTGIIDGDILKCHCRVDDTIVRRLGVMDTSNGHDVDLVLQINKAWNTKRDEFVKIADFLILRDEEEFSQRTNYNASGLSEFYRCFEYCQNVADNTDLQTILNYCRV